MNYDPKAKAYIQSIDGSPENRIVVEIGDTKDSAKFQPQMKILRNDNKQNFSLRIVDDRLKGATVSAYKEGEFDAVSIDGGDIEVLVYPVGKDEMDEGGHKLAIVLKSEPKSNTLIFSVVGKGIELWPQAELTDDEIKRGFERPENVVNSYAIIGLDGVKYGHLYRFQATDAKDQTAWCDSEYDAGAGLLQVTVPQDFLANAAYNVTIE